jgi:hypothetical protein
LAAPYALPPSEHSGLPRLPAEAGHLVSRRFRDCGDLVAARVLGHDRVEQFHFPLSIIEMVPDESQNLGETALGQSQCWDERALDESRKLDETALDENLNQDKTANERHPPCHPPSPTRCRT